MNAAGRRIVAVHSPAEAPSNATASDARSDEQLMAAYVAGDNNAFRVIFERYSPLLTRLMLRTLYRSEEARDLVQQTFLQLHRSRLDFDLSQKLKPWLYTIALNLKREYFRRSKRRPEVSLEHEREPALETLARMDAHLNVMRALSTLPSAQREVIELHWFGGLDFQEAAVVLGASVNALKVRAHRGYRQLRHFLEDDS